eukprot:gene5946-21181_t
MVSRSAGIGGSFRPMLLRRYRPPAAGAGGWRVPVKGGKGAGAEEAKVNLSPLYDTDREGAVVLFRAEYGRMSVCLDGGGRGARGAAGASILLAVGRLAVGRLAVGRLAVGRLAVGRLAVGRLA